MVRVKCINNKSNYGGHELDLTENKEYEVLKAKQDEVLIVNDGDDELWYHLGRFEIVEEDQEETPESISEESNIEDKSLKEILEQEILSLKLQLQKREDMLKCMEIMDNWGVEIQFLEPMPF